MGGKYTITLGVNNFGERLVLPTTYFMRKNHHHCCVRVVRIVVLLFAFVNVCVAQKTSTCTGKAVDEQKQEVAFTTSITYSFDNTNRIKKTETEFFHPLTKHKFGKQLCSFGQYPYAPNYIFENEYTGASEVVFLRQDSLFLYVKNGTNEKPLKAGLRIPENLVIGTGIEYFILNNLMKLLSGERLTIQWLVPSALNYFSFTLYANEEIRRKDEKLLLIKFVANNWKSRWLASPEELLLNLNTKQLDSYTGTTPITKDIEQYPIYRIEYSCKPQ